VDDPAEKDLPKLVSLLRMHSPGNPLGSEQKFWVLGTAHVSAKSSQDVRWACWPAVDETHVSAVSIAGFAVAPFHLQASRCLCTGGW
jgi:hypothetical protein